MDNDIKISKTKMNFKKFTNNKLIINKKKI